MLRITFIFVLFVSVFVLFVMFNKILFWKIFLENEIRKRKKKKKGEEPQPTP